ncbi:MAG: hypothetical protein RQ760_16530 [Sedimentisphaerales bacterium]|nr:hypothetical protein [Sedimentisphaerales bacterium]
MYSFQLNIGSLTSPSVGGGWVDVSPIFGTASINKSVEDQQIFARVKLDGQIKFKGDDFQALNILRLTYAKCDIRVRHTVPGSLATTIFTGELNLWGDYEENKCSLKVEANDDYAELLTGKTKKVNVLNEPAIKCDIEPSYNRLVFYETNVPQSSLWFTHNPASYSIETYAREETVLSDHIADGLDGTGGWAIIETYANGTKKLARTWEDGGFDTPIVTDFTYQDLPADPGYLLNSQYNVGGYRVTLTAAYEILVMDVDLWRLAWLKDEVYYPTATITYSRFRDLRGVIKYIVNKFDSSIQFDDDSWTYLDTHEDLNYLLIANVSDLIPAAGVEKTDEQEFGYLTFDKLMEMLREKLRLYWKIESVGGVPYFRTKHRSEVLYTAGAIDLTAYNGFDWCRDVWSYVDLDIYNRYEREVEAKNIDFLGTDILVPSLDNIAETKVRGDEKWYFDIWDIISRGSDIYPADKDDEFCMIAAAPIETDGNELLTEFINSATLPYASFSYSGGILTTTATSTSLCNSNEFATIKGYLYKITANLTAYTGNAPVIRSSSPDVSFYFRPTKESVTLSSGENTFYAVASAATATATLSIQQSGAGSFTIEDLSIERYIYNCRIETGALSGMPYANAELSVANLDDGHGQYELPDTPATINLTSTVLTSVQLLKNKEQTVQVGIHNPDDIDEEELYTTNKGTLEFRSLKIPLSGGIPEITGRFR